MWENGLIRKLWLNSKLMTTKTVKHIVIIHILPIYQEVKAPRQWNLICLMEDKLRNIFFQKSCRKWGRITSSRPLFFFKKKKKLYIKSKQVVSILVLIYVGRPPHGRTLKNFDFFKKGLGLASRPHFVHGFQEKYFSLNFIEDIGQYVICVL